MRSANRRKKAARGRLSNLETLRSRERRSGNYLLAAGAADIAAVAADEAAAIEPVAAAEAASAADEADDIAAEADASAAEAATVADEAADEAASAAAGVVSAGLLQAVRAATATREANRSDLFMNFLEEKFWVRTNTGNPDTRPHGKYPSKRQQASSSISCA
ncbi:hypothetical protein [Scleromatobacter humisilvae]|uniref:Uncharacterized protein n=1 Tax=Scleromatobacter humisilvae TaxID=2897159 RepID=A0A9X1YJ62_9BURK|nr:hypothetical protein [Scleromatobacter humisilvae]MCK9686682.1 hypothetical protein [Scleromatobacter humisilvae]